MAAASLQWELLFSHYNREIYKKYATKFSENSILSCMLHKTAAKGLRGGVS